MNIIVGNSQQNELVKLDLDVIKSITGCYEAPILVEMFGTFFFNKMILDVTALKNCENINSYKALISGIDADKIIFYLPENTSLCTANFLSKLVDIGIYNFTTNLEGIKYLVKHTNTYQEVEHIQKLAERTTIPTPTEPVMKLADIENVSSMATRIIGIKNVTTQGGATTFIYMLKKELNAILGRDSVLAIEIDKSDFSVFNDKEMISTTRNNLKSLIQKSMNYQIILVDLNDFPDESICSDVYYLLEPSIIKLNKLMRRNNNIFNNLKGRNIVLNKSLLTEKDVTDFEYETKTTIFFNMPPFDDRKRSDAMNNFIIKAGLIHGEKKDNSNRVFGLFRR